MTDATEFTRAGYSPALAIAFEGRSLTVDQVRRMSRVDALDEYLRWNGIIGYAHDILRAIDCIDSVKQARK